MMIRIAEWLADVTYMLGHPRRYILLPLVCWVCRKVLRMTPMRVGMQHGNASMTYFGYFVQWETESVLLTIDLAPSDPMVRVRADGQGLEPAP